MKYLLVFILLLIGKAQAQIATFKEIKLKANPAFFVSSEKTIIFPIVVTLDEKVDSIINAQIRKECLVPDSAAQTLRDALQNRINDGLINLSYEVSYNRNQLLSMNVYIEGCGAHCSSWTAYFNFDTKTGQKIGIRQLISATKIDSLKRIVFAEKKKALRKARTEEVTNLRNREIDSAEYRWVIEQIGDCAKELNMDNFSISPSYLEIMDPCELPNAIRSQTPVYALRYPYSFLAPFLKSKFKFLANR